MWKKKLDENGEQSKLNTTAEGEKKKVGKQGRKKKEECSEKLLTGECVMRCYRKVE